MTVRRGRLMPSRATLLVLAIGISLAAVVAAAADAAHDDNEDRLLRQRTREAASILQAAIPAIQSPLAAAAEALAGTEQPDAERLQAAFGPQVGPSSIFRSAAIWNTDGVEPAVAIGEPPELAQEPPNRIRAFVAKTTSRGELTVYDLLDGGTPRLGYGLVSRSGDGSIIYAEQELPRDRTTILQDGEAFEGVAYAVYLGETEHPEQLILSSTNQLPLAGRRAEEPLILGDASVLLVVATTDDLGGSLSEQLPALALMSGGAATLAAGALTERSQRQRRRAEVLAAENERLYAEQRNRSLQLQQSLLPPSLPQVDGVALAVRYETGVAGTAVGGDWYDAVDIGDALVLIVGDVSGRGLSAASSMASARHTIRALAGQQLPPDRILTEANRILEVAHEGQFVTVVCGSVPKRGGVATFASAGHPPPLLVDRGSASWLDVPAGPPLGAVPDARYELASAALPQGATLLMVTDGLFERRDEPIQEGLERLRRAASVDMAELEPMLDRVVQGMATSSSQDDTAILAARWGT